MARLALLLVVCQLFSLPLVARSDGDSPLLDLASSFLQNLGNDGGNNAMNGLSALSGVLGTLMQGDNAKNLGALFGQNGGGGGNAGDLLSGLGSLLGGQDGKIDPAVIGSMVSMFAQQMSTTEKPKARKLEKTEADAHVASLVDLASNFFGKDEEGGAMGMLGLAMDLFKLYTDPESKKRAFLHKDHADFLPPFLEKIHLYWDIFINSDLGKVVWEKSGLKRGLKAFTGPDGKLSFEMMYKNFENHSFRRHWIKIAAKYLTDMIINLAKPEVYSRYLVSAQFLTNSFLDSQGMPKSTHLDMKRPEESITSLLNYVLKKFFTIDTDVGEYVRPAIQHIKETIEMARAGTKKLSSKIDANAVADRLTDTLNLEFIEPVIRVYRAYKHSVEAPHCQEHLMCLVNRHYDNDKELAGFKTGLTKVSSVIASAALSYQHGGGFLDLYKAIKNDVNCDAAYPADCSAFHEHELKVTTEQYHSEL